MSPIIVTELRNYIMRICTPRKRLQVLVNFFLGCSLSLAVLVEKRSSTLQLNVVSSDPQGSEYFCKSLIAGALSTFDIMYDKINAEDVSYPIFYRYPIIQKKVLYPYSRGHIIPSSVAEPHNFYVAPAQSKNFYAAPAHNRLFSKAKFLKGK
jgi:hypothetical protein